ncbi:MAG: alpha/beta fold hydrolase [Rhizobiaceae bacterium]
MAFGGILALIAATVGLGPTEPVDETITFQESDLGNDLDAYLTTRESHVPGITPGAEKQIIWSDPNAKAKTPIALVYLHGFSATLEETRPMPDIIAKDLGANIYYTRLTGHGRDGEALAQATVNDWYNDTAEALAIGRTIGEKVIVIGVSTGATFATWAAASPSVAPDLMTNVAGMILASPNYGVNNPSADLLTLGAARQWLPFIAGAERSFDAVSEEHAKWWTTSYPTVALLPMMASVQHVSGLEVEKAAIPALFIYHPTDQVVRSDLSRQFAERWGSKTDAGAATLIHEVLEAEDRYDHVIAGRILSPKNSEPLAKRAVDWINSL